MSAPPAIRPAARTLVLALALLSSAAASPAKGQGDDPVPAAPPSSRFT